MPTDPTLWHVKHKEHDGTLICDIRPENLQFNLNKKPPHTIQYEMSLARPEVDHDFIGPYRTDWELWLGDYRIMAGPHVAGPEVALGDDHCTIYGKDWFHLLERMQYPFDPRPHPPFTPGHVNDYVIGSPAQGKAYEVAATDVNVIMKNIFDVVKARPHHFQFTYPTLTTHLGIPVNFALDLADSTTIAQIVDGLSDSHPGFVYEILDNKEFRVYSPEKYDMDVVTDPSLAIYTFDDTNIDVIEELTFINNGPAATHLFGKGPGFNQVTYGAALGYDPSQTVYRRLDESIDFSEVLNRDEVVSRTMTEFSKMLNPQHEITMKVDPFKITDFWILFSPGQPVWIDIDLVAHQIQSAQEISQMNCTVDNQGNATVDFGFEQIYAGTAGTAEG